METSLGVVDGTTDGTAVGLELGNTEISFCCGLDTVLGPPDDSCLVGGAVLSASMLLKYGCLVGLCPGSREVIFSNMGEFSLGRFLGDRPGTSMLMKLFPPTISSTRGLARARFRASSSARQAPLPNVNMAS